MTTGIVVALAEELRTLTPRKINQGEWVALTDGTLITLSGSGIENADKAARNLLKQGATQLISWGCAGALAPHLKAGDLFIPHHILTKQQKALATQASLSELIINTLDSHIKCYTGILFESTSVITLAQEKVTRYQLTGALAVDMESGAVARVALMASIPFVAIRSIVDPANMDLPDAISYAMTPAGIISLPRLIYFLCQHPTELPSLIRLGMHFSAAHKTLTHIARHIPQITKVQ